MTEEISLFDLVLTGQLAQGVERSDVVVHLSQLFKMSPEKVAHLLESAPVVLKRGLAWDAAKRYRVAIKQAGALSDIRPSESVNAALVENVLPAVTPPNPPVEPEKIKNEWLLAELGADVLTEQERAPVASRLDEFTDFSLRPNLGNLLDTTEYKPEVLALANLGEAFDLLPAGSAVLAEHERALPVAALIATPDFDVAVLGERLSSPRETFAQVPDVSHLELTPEKTGDTL
ncbi:MAG: hypothetical protein RL497_695 [Pseudomonadota bacterium]|jgi:hypothetical protein